MRLVTVETDYRQCRVSLLNFKIGKFIWFNTARAIEARKPLCFKATRPGEAKKLLCLNVSAGMT
jgi:hypothetical protein